MKKLLASFALAATLVLGSVLPAAAAPSSGTILRTPGATPIKNSYIVTFKQDKLSRKQTKTTSKLLAKLYGGSVKHTYQSTVRGFSVRMNEAQAKRLAADPRVKYVEQDAIATSDATATQASPTAWGLDRIDQAALPLSASYTYPSDGAAGVTAYVIDSGIRTTHNEFGGRASNGYDFINNDAIAEDCTGHGTHVAGTIGGATRGVAKAVDIVGVRVLGCNGTGAYSTIIAGVDWVTANATLPAVANMSLGGVGSVTLDDAVQDSINAGITYSISAGNANSDACNQSPARLPAAITVAATDNTDTRWANSNYGNCVDIFAPGVSISSAYFSSDTTTARMTGTSMAAPHATGLAALKLAADTSLTPAQIQDSIIADSTPGTVINAGPGSPDQLLYLIP
jgi:subtilisin family serine protease